MKRTPPAPSEEEAVIKYVCGIDMGSQSCAGCMCRPDKSVVEKRDHVRQCQGRLADLGRETEPVGCSTQPDSHRDGSHLPRRERISIMSESSVAMCCGCCIQDKLITFTSNRVYEPRPTGSTP